MKNTNWLTTLLSLAIVFLVTLAATLIILEFTAPEHVALAPSEVAKEVQTSNLTINAKTLVKSEIFYKACRHIVTQEREQDDDFINKTPEELQQAGWQIIRNSDGSITASKTEEGLCPKDAAKYHLLSTTAGFALYKGPLGYDEEKLQEYVIDTKMLPAEWQKALTQSGIEYADEEEMLLSLENFDEYLY